jgi:hypothetical protein
MDSCLRGILKYGGEGGILLVSALAMVCRLLQYQHFRDNTLSNKHLQWKSSSPRDGLGRPLTTSSGLFLRHIHISSYHQRALALAQFEVWRPAPGKRRSGLYRALPGGLFGFQKGGSGGRNRLTTCGTKLQSQLWSVASACRSFILANWFQSV